MHTHTLSLSLSHTHTHIRSIKKSWTWHPKPKTVAVRLFFLKSFFCTDLHLEHTYIYTMYIYARDIIHSFEWDYTSRVRLHIYVFLLTRIRVPSHWYVRHDWFVYRTWLIHMCDMTHIWLIHIVICVIWRIHTCDVTHSYMWHGSFVCVTRLEF